MSLQEIYKEYVEKNCPNCKNKYTNLCNIVIRMNGEAECTNNEEQEEYICQKERKQIMKQYTK